MALAESRAFAKVFFKNLRCTNHDAHLGLYCVVFLSSRVDVQPTRPRRNFSKIATGPQTRRLPDRHNLRDGGVFVLRCPKGEEIRLRADSLLQTWARSNATEYV